MSEYEISDLILSAVNGGTSVIAGIITVISGYLITAWLVGSKLTRAQVTFINLLFLAFTPAMIWGWMGRYLVALKLQHQPHALNPDAIGGVSPYIIGLTTTIFLLAVLGSLKFMWDIRHPNSR